MKTENCFNCSYQRLCWLLLRSFIVSTQEAEILRGFCNHYLEAPALETRIDDLDEVLRPKGCHPLSAKP